MRYHRILFGLLAMLSLVSCQTNGGRNADVSSHNEENSGGGANSSTGKVSSRAYNAYNLWAKTTLIDISNEHSDEPRWVHLGKEPLTEFPKEYDHKQGEAGIDDAFFVHRNTWRDNGSFVGAPTKMHGQRLWTPDQGWHEEDAGPQPEVKGNILSYPPAPLPLTLKFSDASEKAYTHDDAVKYCKKLEGRLPTAREIFDFCALGVKGVEFGKEGDYAKNAKNARCAKQDLWSVSVSADDLSAAWRFDSNDGDLDAKKRDSFFYQVRCVLFQD